MYEIDLKYIGVENVVLIVITVLMFLLFKYITKITAKLSDCNCKYAFAAKAVSLFLIAITLIVNIVSISQRINIVNSYKNNQYSKVSGEVEDFSCIWANNSNTLIGLEFTVDGVDFHINNGVLNYGYSINDEFVISEGDYVEICYTDNETILRIEKH